MKQKSSRRFLPNHNSNNNNNNNNNNNRHKPSNRAANTNNNNNNSNNNNNDEGDVYLNILGEQLTLLEGNITAINERFNPGTSDTTSATGYTPMDLFNAVIESTKWPTGSERRSRLVMERRRIETTEHAVIHADFIKSLGQDTRNQHLEWGVTNRGRALGELYTNRVLASMELVQAAEQERFSLLARHHREIAMEDNIRQAAELLIRRDSMNRVVVAINELQQRTRQRFNAILAKKMPITTNGSTMDTSYSSSSSSSSSSSLVTHSNAMPTTLPYHVNDHTSNVDTLLADYVTNSSQYRANPFVSYCSDNPINPVLSSTPYYNPYPTVMPCPNHHSSSSNPSDSSLIDAPTTAFMMISPGTNVKAAEKKKLSKHEQ